MNCQVEQKNSENSDQCLIALEAVEEHIVSVICEQLDISAHEKRVIVPGANGYTLRCLGWQSYREPGLSCWWRHQATGGIGN